MINATFKLANELISIKIEGNNLGFFDLGSGQMTTLEGLKLSKVGVIKEHPDLKDDEEWRKKAIERLKAHMKKIPKEFDKLLYVKDELEKFGYEALHYRKAGFRDRRFA